MNNTDCPKGVMMPCKHCNQKQVCEDSIWIKEKTPEEYKEQKKRILSERFLFFQPEIIFDGMTGGKQLIMEVDAFNGHINWMIKTGDHYQDFDNFEDALEEYVREPYKIIGLDLCPPH